MLYCRDTARLRHYSLSFSAFLSSFLYLPSSLFSAPLRCAALRKRQARSRRDLVTLLPVMSRVRSTFLSAPVAPPALLRRETRTRERTYTQLPYIRSHAVYLLSSRSSSRLFLSLFLRLSLSLSEFSLSLCTSFLIALWRARARGTALQVQAIRNVYHPPSESFLLSPLARSGNTDR